MKKAVSLLLCLAMLLCCLSAGLSASAAAPASLFNVYGNNMLFMQNHTVTLAGTAPAGQTVEAELLLNGTSVRSGSGIAAADGSFAVSFDGVVGSYTEYIITVRANGSEFARLTGIVFGELWLANGQSNMQFALGTTPDGAQLAKDGFNDKYIRILREDVLPSFNGEFKNYSDAPQNDIDAACVRWLRGDNNSGALTDVSALGFFFAQELRRELDMPIGILDTSIGGSSIYAWLSPSVIDSTAGARSYIESVSSKSDNSSTGGLYDVSRAYNHKIYPLRNFSISGMIWYQGESNVGEAQGKYADALALLQKDYSSLFGFTGSTMPLICSHIAPYYYGNDFIRPGLFSENFGMAYKLNPNYFSHIPIYDLPLDFDFEPYTGLGGSHPIHPTTKSPIGERMAYAAMGMVYGAQSTYSAPLLVSSRIEGKYVYATLGCVGDGLACPSEALHSFSICGSNGIFTAANAEIVSRDTVRIWSDYISSPVSAAYAYSQNCNTANLYSTENGSFLFPAAPFLTTKLDNTLHYEEKDWLSCDIERTFHNTGKQDGYYDTWKVKDSFGASVDLSFDKQTKYSGDSALRVDYSSYTPTGCSFSVSPVLAGINSDGFPAAFRDTQTDYSHLDTLVVRIKNAGNKPITLTSLKIRTSMGLLFAPVIEETESLGVTVAPNSEWQTLTFDLTRLYAGASLSSFALDSSIALKNVYGFTFCFKGQAGSGSVYLDALELADTDASACNAPHNLSLLASALLFVGAAAASWASTLTSLILRTIGFIF